MHKFLDVHLCYSKSKVRIKGRLVNDQVKASVSPLNKKTHADCHWTFIPKTGVIRDP